MIGTGSFIPPTIVPNSAFENNEFYTAEKKRIEEDGKVIIEKFKAITGISERRYLKPDTTVSDIAAQAAQKAIDDAGIDPETLDHIILAHNMGDIEKDSHQIDIMPSLAARVKHILKIKNPSCIAYDILFGCPGWIQTVLQAHAYIKAGFAKRILVIGADALSRVNDPHDRDSMIFADGAGAAIIEAQESDKKEGILSYSMRTDTLEEAYYLYFGESYNPDKNEDIKYIKMHGRKIYEYALNKVPQAMKDAMDRSGEDIDSLKKVFIHQANEKMDEAFIKRLYRLYKKPIPKDIMPMSIHKLGNSSTATVPTLLDLVRKGEFPEHKLAPGEVYMFASVGAGMHINAFVYKN